VDFNNILIAVRYLNEDRNHHRPTARKMINQREQAELGKKMKEPIRTGGYKGQYLIFSMFEIYGY